LALVAVGVLARRTIPNRDIALLATALAAALLISPVQWWNWLFGIQIVVFLPFLLLAVGLVIGEKHPVIAAFCALIATYSYSNGMLLWVLLVPMRRRRREVALWIA